MNNLIDITKRLRTLILESTSKAGSGHPTSCLSAVELLTVLLFDSNFTDKDHLIFSKGHAAPLLYALYVEKKKITREEIMTLRQFGSRLEGHPTPKFPFSVGATGSLGQGLGIGMGMALYDQYVVKNNHQTYVLLGDGELTEGSNWETINLADHYKLDNLTAIVDVNRLEQDGQTPTGWDLFSYKAKFDSFGWQTILIDNGHDINSIKSGFETKKQHKPRVIIAKTIKGKGVSFLEDKPNWHGKALNKEQLSKALKEFGQTNTESSDILLKLTKLYKNE